MSTNQKNVLAAAAFALVALVTGACGHTVAGPGLLSEDCFLENPPPSCRNTDPPTENVVPAGLEESSVTLAEPAEIG
jgi:hypothetical protein